MLTCILNTLFKSHGFVFDPSEFNTISRRLLVAHDGFQGGVVAGMTWVGLGQAVSPAVFQESPVDDWLRSKFLCPMESLGFFMTKSWGFSSYFHHFSSYFLRIPIFTLDHLGRSCQWFSSSNPSRSSSRCWRRSGLNMARTRWVAITFMGRWFSLVFYILGDTLW